MADSIELDLVDSEITLEVIGEVGPRGPMGPQGDQGIQGIQGTPGEGAGFYRHSQAIAATQWNFTHDLSFPAAITVIDSAGTVLYADVTYVTDNTIQINFDHPVAGYAYCT